METSENCQNVFKQNVSCSSIFPVQNLKVVMKICFSWEKVLECLEIVLFILFKGEHEEQGLYTEKAYKNYFSLYLAYHF